MLPLPQPDDIRQGLAQAWQVLRQKPDALLRFSHDRRALLLSFWVIPLLLPLQLWDQTLSIKAAAGMGAQPQLLSAQVIGVLCFVCSWLLFPVVIARPLARQGKLHRLPAFLVAQNWTLALIALLGFAASVLLPFLLMPLSFYSLVLRWQMKKQIFAISGARAFGYTVAEMLLLGLLFLPFADALGIFELALAYQQQVMAS